MLYALDNMAPEMEDKFGIIATEDLYGMFLEHPCHLFCYFCSMEVGNHTFECDVVFTSYCLGPGWYSFFSFCRTGLSPHVNRNI